MVKDRKMLKQDHRRFAGSFGYLRHMGYEQRLGELSLYFLEGRRDCGDLIKAFKNIRIWPRYRVTVEPYSR